MNEENQKKTFLRTIGGDESAFLEERLLERNIQEQILSCPREKRDMAYREGYEKLHKFFISVAGSEHLYKGANLQRSMWKQTLLARTIGKNQKILEVGCGEGLFSIALSRPGNNVKGIDVSDTCITLANKNKKLFGANNVNFSRMNATELNFPSNTFDWIISVDLIEHLHPEDTLNHLIEAARILKAKGKYLLITPNSKAGPHAGDVHLKEYNLEDLTAILRRAGFSSKLPLLNRISPINILINPQIKVMLERLPITQSLANLALGLDPIVLIAQKQN